MCEAAALALHLPDTVESHGHNGNAKIFREQADAGLKRRHPAIRGVVHHAFGKNQHAVAAIRRFAGKAEAFPEAGELRQRENIEERGDQPIADRKSTRLNSSHGYISYAVFCLKKKKKKKKKEKKQKKE